MSKVIEIKNLQKIYDPEGKNPTTALRGINLSVNEGEFVAIMGRSGSGKSSFMHIIGLLDQHFEGEYLLNRVSVRELSQSSLSDLRSSEIGFVFQQFNLLKRRTVLQNVLLPTVYKPASDDTERAKEAIKRVGLESRITHRTNELSGGQIQRVAIARALMMKPSLLLADEPTGNLDTKSAGSIMKLFREVNEQGTTIVLITHEEDIARYADRTIRLRDGKIIEEVKS
ncbi:ABC transporter ATP-binding protein [Candidatus Saccharibacteria bacterium]|nr:ABC transporter ATP-binding protein [Candidatus Saccharibacteria bacterium]